VFSSYLILSGSINRYPGKFNKAIEPKIKRTMKTKPRIIGVMVVSLSLFMSGCVNPDGTPNNTASGALIGGLAGAFTGAATSGRHGGQNALIGAAIGAVAGAVIGNVMDRINADQRAKLQQSSPQTLQTIQHNDQVAQQQSAPPPASGNSAPPADAPTPLKVDDIKALTAAGVKPDAIINAIKQSKPATYSSDDIQAAQQATPPVDPSVIAYMQNPSA
jgi:predicted lipid-binding transport protein (Tim44 family)